jgi:hypothetical protein
MAERLYSPQLSAEVVSALYHEARSRHMPMTRLANMLLADGLRNTPSWQLVTKMQEISPHSQT